MRILECRKGFSYNFYALERTIVTNILFYARIEMGVFRTRCVVKLDPLIIFTSPRQNKPSTFVSKIAILNFTVWVFIHFFFIFLMFSILLIWVNLVCLSIGIMVLLDLLLILNTNNKYKFGKDFLSNPNWRLGELELEGKRLNSYHLFLRRLIILVKKNVEERIISYHLTRCKHI